MSSLAAAVEGWARRSSGATALATPEGVQMSYAGLAARVAEVSAWLGGVVEPGQVVALLAGNGAAAVPVIAATASSAVCAPLAPGRSTSDRSAELALLGASMLLVVEGCGTAEDEQAAVRAGIPLVYLKGLPDGRIDGPRCRLEPPPALLMRTSGTTGAEKLVPLGSDALLRAARLVAETLGLGPHDLGLNVMPLHHTHGLVGSVLSSMAAGGGVTCLPHYTDELWANEFGATWYTAVPAIHSRVAALAESGRLARQRLRFVRSASAPLTGHLRRRLGKALGVPVIQAYALTEAPGQVCSHRPGDEVLDGSVGRPHGCEVKVVDGEILVRGSHLSPGYLSSVDGELTPHSGGWLHTGDLGHLTPDGELILRGRRDDVINRAGEKILPGEVEEALAACPGVTDAAVFGVPDPVLGQAIAAVIVGDFPEGTLSRGRTPDVIIFTDRIPRSPTGKVDRHELSRLRPEPAGDLLDAVARIWAQVLFLPAVDVDAAFAELGGGSLQSARLEALVAERFGVDLPPMAATEAAPTVRRMAALISGLIADR